MAESRDKSSIKRFIERLKQARPSTEGGRAKKNRTMDNDQKRTTHPVLSKIKFMERGDLLRVVNGAYIAERFFGKSGSWFSQKLNNNIKNGKPCEFTDEEREILSNALHTIAIELQDLADELQ